MKKSLLVLALLVAPGVFSATPSESTSAASSRVDRKKKKKKVRKKKTEAQTPADQNQHSGNAVQEAEGQNQQSLQNELKNNPNAGGSMTSKGTNASTVYPRSADPDVTDSYNTENRLGEKVKEPVGHGNEKTREREASTGSTAADSLSGSSSLPKKGDDSSK